MNDRNHPKTSWRYLNVIGEIRSVKDLDMGEGQDVV
jgi:hypothetical protein